jgi:hypothetical protein
LHNTCFDLGRFFSFIAFISKATPVVVRGIVVSLGVLLFLLLLQFLLQFL